MVLAELVLVEFSVSMEMSGGTEDREDEQVPGRSENMSRRSARYSVGFHHPFSEEFDT